MNIPAKKFKKTECIYLTLAIQGVSILDNFIMNGSMPRVPFKIEGWTKRYKACF